MKYNVGTIRETGLQARWTKTRGGAPIIVARVDDGSPWYAIDKFMWEDAKSYGIREAFESHTVLGDIFGIRGGTV